MDRSGATSPGSADPPAKARPRAAPDESTNPDGSLKCCTDCRTTKTPLWRGGPSGPKSLCNACGIRYRKRRREMLGIKSRPASDKGRKEKQLDHCSSGGSAPKVPVVRKKRPRSLLWLKRRRQRQLGEEEQAAILLMALSTGFLPSCMLKGMDRWSG